MFFDAIFSFFNKKTASGNGFLANCFENIEIKCYNLNMKVDYIYTKYFKCGSNTSINFE